MSFKLHLILDLRQIRCNFPDISNLSETQKNNFQFLSKFNMCFVNSDLTLKTSYDPQ